ncbi:MAG: hypothetical protein M0Z61_09130 [Nitrospiraceae bacterium]|nr:hypothetical protein [Nitrospiraceae bacterium]
MSEQFPNLSDLLPEKFKSNLTEAEKKLLAATQLGVEANYSSEVEEANNPACASTWGNDRILRADFIRWLCIDKKCADFIDPKVVLIIGAKISGALDFMSCSLQMPLAMIRCSLENIDFTNASANAILLYQSVVKSITASALNTKGRVSIEGISTTGRVELMAANIGGDLIAARAILKNKGGKAFSADGLTTKGNVYLDGVSAEGEVRFLSANIGANLYAHGANFKNEGGCAFNADGLSAKGNVYLDRTPDGIGMTAEGEVRFLGANIGANLYAHGAILKNKDGNAFSADNLSIKGNVFLEDATAEGEVRFLSASVGGDLIANRRFSKINLVMPSEPIVYP